MLENKLLVLLFPGCTAVAVHHGSSTERSRQSAVGRQQLRRVMVSMVLWQQRRLSCIKVTCLVYHVCYYRHNSVN